jgi:hypothetical protein
MKLCLCSLALLLVFSGCRKRETASQVKLDACSLLTKAEIEAVQGSAITESKVNEHSDAGLRMSQCYFSAKESSKSVSLVVTQVDPGHPGNRTPKDFWKETFGRGSTGEKEHDGDKEEERESAPPTKIDGIGDEAYWIGSRVGGALYAIKKSTFIRISVGGPDNQETKIDKSKKLAAKALERL